MDKLVNEKPLSLEATQALMREADISQIRRAITINVADTESLLGTVADGAGLLIIIALADIVALADSTTFAAYKTAKFNTLNALAGDADLVLLASNALAKIQSGDAVATASLKGVESVIAENLNRSTAIAAILSDAAPK